MSEIIKRRAAPRIENGVIYFREGDTFVLNFHVELKNMGVSVAPEEILKIILMIRDDTNRVVYFEESEADGNGNASFIFAHSVSAEFTKGRYNYDVTVGTARDRTTVADKLSIVVT